MVITIKLDDKVYEKYAAMDKLKPSMAMEKQLEAFQDVKPTDRVLFLSTSERRELERLLERTFANGQELINRVKQTVAIEVGKVSVDLSETQRHRLSAQAQFWKRDPQELTAETVKRVLFEQLGS